MFVWGLRWFIIFGLVLGGWILLRRFFVFWRSKQRSQLVKDISSRGWEAFSYKRLLRRYSPKPPKKSRLGEAKAEGPAENKLTRSSERSLEALESQGITLPLLLAARAAERGMLPFYSLCGAMFIDAIPQRLYHLNYEYQAVLLSDIVNIPDANPLTHVLAVYRGDDEPVMAITSEVNKGQEQFNLWEKGIEAAREGLSWGEQLWRNDDFSHSLGMFFKEKHRSIDTSERWSHLETFEKRAVRLALDTLEVHTAPHVMDDGSSTKFMDFSTFDQELQKDLAYCLELQGMFIMVRIALQDSLTEEELEQASLHRFRIDIYLRAFSSQERIPIDLSMMMLADLQGFSENVQEHLEGNSLSYLDVIGPVYQEETLLVPLDQLSWDERTQRQERIFDNLQLLATIQKIVDAIEESTDVRFKEQLQRVVPSFDV